MEPSWPPNFIQIVVHCYRFELQPKLDRFCTVRPVLGEKLRIAADWTRNKVPDTGKRKWKRIVICNFALVNPPAELPPYKPPPDVVIEDGDYNSKEIEFDAFPASVKKLVCSFDIDYVPDNPVETCTLDPVIILRPAGMTDDTLTPI